MGERLFYICPMIMSFKNTLKTIQDFDSSEIAVLWAVSLYHRFVISLRVYFQNCIWKSASHNFFVAENGRTQRHSNVIFSPLLAAFQFCFSHSVYNWWSKSFSKFIDDKCDTGGDIEGKGHGPFNPRGAGVFSWTPCAEGGGVKYYPC